MKKPSSFFKFVTKERADILKNGMIRFTPPTDFNDPFELNPCVTHFTKNAVVATEYSESDMDFSITRFHKIKEHQEIINKYANEHGVLSLSASHKTNPNPAIFMDYETDPRMNLLMWAHYCDKHTGFAIEFAPDFIPGEAKEVIYTNERPVCTFEEIIDNSHCIYLHKSPEWKYESEWRYFKKLSDADSSPSPSIRLFKINKKSLKSITFGCRASEETKSSVLQILKSDSDYANVQTFFADISKQSFSLEFHQEIHEVEHCWSNASEFTGSYISIQKKPADF